MEWRNLDLLAGKDEAKFVIADRADYEWSRDLVRERSAGRALCRCCSRPCTAGSIRASSARWILDDGLRRAAAGPAPQVPVARRGARGMKPLAVVCVSGGMDSCVTAAMAAQRASPGRSCTPTTASARRPGSAPASRRLADHFAAEHRLVVDFPHLGAIGGSSLTDRAIPVREGAPEAGRIPTSYVPFRNAHLLSAATSWAEVLGARGDLRRRRLGGLVGLSRLPARVLRGVPGGHRPGHAARRRASAIVTPVIRHDQGRDRAAGPGARRAVREDVVLLPVGGGGLRALRVVPAAAARLRARRASPTPCPIGPPGAQFVRDSQLRGPHRPAKGDKRHEAFAFGGRTVRGRPPRSARRRSPRPGPRAARCSTRRTSPSPRR